jgi:hypothetical protein
MIEIIAEDKELTYSCDGNNNVKGIKLRPN